MRNYRAMGDEKLARCLNELLQQQGDAYTRVVRAGDDVEAHRNAVLSAATARGWDTDLSKAQYEEHTPLPPEPGEAVYIKPQLAFDPGQAVKLDEYDPEAWVMEPKFDGWRWQVHVSGPFDIEGDLGRPYVWSIGGRNGKDHSGTMPEIDEALAELIPPGTVLDGELVFEGGRVGTLKLKTKVFVVFDVLRYEGTDSMSSPWADRRRLLEVMADWKASEHLAIAPYAPVLPALLEAWLELGMEGAVLKRRDAPYRPGSRRRDGFVKVKPQSTTHATVIGWELGKGASNRDRCGALVIRLHDTGAVTSVGYDAPQHEAEALGQRNAVVEIAHYGFQQSGKVLHPCNAKLRPDLEPAR